MGWVVPPGHLTGLETQSPLHPSASKPGSTEWEAGSILRPELGQTRAQRAKSSPAGSPPNAQAHL